MTPSTIELFVIGFGRPDLLRQQKRLLDKHLQDPFGLTMIDNTPAPLSGVMESTCKQIGVGYLHAPSGKGLHPDALDYAAQFAADAGFDYFGFLDHDIFPVRPTTIVDKLDAVGFLGIGQTHPATGSHYLWPGFCFFARRWLAGRRLNFQGIRGILERDNGDCGSMNWPLFSDEDWKLLWSLEHGYQPIREPDEHGLQSWGIEKMGDFIHFTNASHWKAVPKPQERDALLGQLLDSL